MTSFIPAFLRAAAAFGLLVSLGTGVANARPDSKMSEPFVDAAPVTINGAGFALDPGFNGGNHYLDRFGGGANADYRGRKIVQLANGDVVVAGLVPRYQQGNQADGYANVGLVRYNASGVRVPWAFTSTYGNFNNNYLIYPGSQTAGQLTPRFSAIKDIKAIGNRIYVMVDHDPEGASRNVHVLVFNDEGSQSGQFLGHFGLFTSAFNESGGGLAVYSTGIVNAPYKLIAVSTVFGGSGNYVSTRRFNIGGANAFEGDNTFGSSGVTNVFLFTGGSRCTAAVAVANACPIVATGVATGFRGFTSAGPIYISAERQYAPTTSTSNDWDGAVIKLDSSGSFDTSFGAAGVGAGNGFSFIQFDYGTDEDRSRGIVVRTVGLGIPASPYRDEIHTVLSIAQQCSAGIGVAKLDENGAYIAAFGSSGKMRFGGWDDPGNAQACALITASTPFALALNGPTLGIAGQAVDLNSFDLTSGASVALVGRDDGSLLQVATTAIRPPGGGSPGSGALYGIVASPNDSFSVTGDTRDPANGNRLMVATARYGNDRIFANGFD